MSQKSFPGMQELKNEISPEMASQAIIAINESFRQDQPYVLQERISLFRRLTARAIDRAEALNPKAFAAGRLVGVLDTMNTVLAKQRDEKYENRVTVPLSLGTKVWGRFRKEILPMRITSIRLETFGPFMTAIYDGPDPAYEGCGLKDLLESDIGHRIFLSEEAAKAYYNV